MPNPIYGTSGDDNLTGTTGSDIFYLGTSTYFDIVYDPGGNDTYVLSAGGYSAITDDGGYDTAIMTDYDLDDLLFMTLFDSTIAVVAKDSSGGVWFENMVNNPTVGIDCLVLGDCTLSRADILTLASEF